MTVIRAIGAFAWDFVVGDDWVSAVGVVLAIALTALVARGSAAAWWILPLAVAGLLWLYLWRAVRADRREREGDG